jgi:hypothetical protein
MHPALLRASALLAAPPSAAETTGAADASRVPPSAPGLQVPAAALLAAQQLHQFETRAPASVTVIRPTAAHAVAGAPATLPHSAAQPAPPAAYSIMAHAAAVAPAATAAHQQQLQQLGVSAMTMPQQPGVSAHPLLLPARQSVEEWPCSEPAALIRSAFSGPQPLLAAFAEAQFGQVSSLVSELSHPEHRELNQICSAVTAWSRMCHILHMPLVTGVDIPWSLWHCQRHLAVERADGLCVGGSLRVCMSGSTKVHQYCRSRTLS